MTWDILLFFAMIISFLIIVAVLLVIKSEIDRVTEKRKWNNGFCSKCKTEWKYFDMNLEGKKFKCSGGHKLIVRFPYDTLK